MEVEKPHPGLSKPYSRKSNLEAYYLPEVSD